MSNDLLFLVIFPVAYVFITAAALQGHNKTWPAYAIYLGFGVAGYLFHPQLGGFVWGIVFCFLPFVLVAKKKEAEKKAEQEATAKRLIEEERARQFEAKRQAEREEAERRAAYQRAKERLKREEEEKARKSAEWAEFERWKAEQKRKEAEAERERQRRERERRKEAPKSNREKLAALLGIDPNEQSPKEWRRARNRFMSRNHPDKNKAADLDAVQEVNRLFDLLF